MWTHNTPCFCLTSKNSMWCSAYNNSTIVPYVHFVEYSDRVMAHHQPFSSAVVARRVCRVRALKPAQKVSRGDERVPEHRATHARCYREHCTMSLVVSHSVLVPCHSPTMPTGDCVTSHLPCHICAGRARRQGRKQWVENTLRPVSHALII